MAFDLQMNSNFPALKLRERAADKPQRTEGRAATKTRILAATEKLFIVHGFDATSLRAITTEAGVNLAAVNYHFGSKEELFAIVLTNRLDALNLERVRLLDALEAKGIDAALHVEQLIATDPTLAYGLLRLVNSSSYGLTVHVQSIRHAIVMLGSVKAHFLEIEASCAM